MSAIETHAQPVAAAIGSRSRSLWVGALLLQAIPLFIALTIPMMFIRYPTAAALMLSFVLGWTVLVGPCGCAHTSALGSDFARQTRSRWWAFFGSYAIGGCLAGALTGLTLWTLGDLANLPRASWFSLLALFIGLLCLLREIGMRIPLPEVRRQTRWKWISNPASPINPLLWSMDVGFVFGTWITLSGAWFLATLALREESPWIAAGVFSAYWLGRALPHLVEKWVINSSVSSLDVSCAIQKDFRSYRLIHATALLLFLVPFATSTV